MKRKQTVISLIVLLCVGLGVCALFKMHGTAPTSDEEEENVPTVVSVQVGAIERMMLHRYVNGYGTVEPAPATATEPAADAPLAAPTSGVVADVNVAEGQHVRKGEVLMTLNAGSATAKYAEEELARQKRLYAQHNTSLKNLQDAEARLALLRVAAPLSGTVTRVNVKPGAAVDVNTVVAEVMDLHRLVVKTDIPASRADELEPGQKVQVLTQPPVATALSFVSPTVDTRNGTVLARAMLPADSGLRPGQFVSLRIVTAVHSNCLVAPEESVVTDVNGHSAVSLVTDDEAIRTPVQTGFRENGWVEVEGTGLKAGDAVVTVGAYGLPDKTEIRVVRSPDSETPTTSSDSSSAQ
jgi:multidrug efflux pump subunit AcrA (membrane-fusion protein)